MRESSEEIIMNIFIDQLIILNGIHKYNLSVKLNAQIKICEAFKFAIVNRNKGLP